MVKLLQTIFDPDKSSTLEWECIIPVIANYLTYFEALDEWRGFKERAEEICEYADARKISGNISRIRHVKELDNLIKT
eukprot:UN14514